MAIGALLFAGLGLGAPLGVYLDRQGQVARLVTWLGPQMQRLAGGGASVLGEAAAQESRPPEKPLDDRERTFASIDPAELTAEKVSRKADRTAPVAQSKAPPPDVVSWRLSERPKAAPSRATTASAAGGDSLRPLSPAGTLAAVSLAPLLGKPATPRSAAARAPEPEAAARLPLPPAPEPPMPVPSAFELAPAELHVVYEEPLDRDEELPPPSERLLDRFVDERNLDQKEPVSEVLNALPQWQRESVQVADLGGRPMIALVLDDLGLNRPNTRRAVALPGPLTLAFMTYAERIDGLLADARAAGHELLVHLPMQPRDPRYNPGPNVLSNDLSAEEIADRMAWGLSRFEGYVGINNHMGSRFSTSLPGMAQVMKELKRRGLLFLDSKTSSASVGAGLAERMQVPFAERDIFIDNDHRNAAAIERQLDALERLARKRGFAVGIGHPHDATLDVLADWLPAAVRRGIALVPISAVVQRRIELVRAAENAG